MINEMHFSGLEVASGSSAKQCLRSVKHESSERISSKSDVPRDYKGKEKRGEKKHCEIQ